MSNGNPDITFLIPGEAQPVGRPSASLRGMVKGAVRVGARRGDGEVQRLSARPGEDIVLLRIANGPTLYLHPQNARELIRAQQVAPRAAARRSPRWPSSPGSPGSAPAPFDDALVVPARLDWRGLDAGAAPRAPDASRGMLGDVVGGVVLDAVEVVKSALVGSAADLAADAIVAQVDGQVDPGLYRLAPDALPETLKGSSAKVFGRLDPAPSDAPILVFIHGTFSCTAGTFAKLWELHADNVRSLFARYGGRVYALDHPTVGASPFANALTLLDALPDGARLHLVTHSRGGIVAELLARICGGQGLDDSSRALFADERYAQQRAQLDQLAAQARRGIRVDRVVRVACPARGTLLASRRLDAYLSVFKWGLELAGLPVVPELLGFLSEVARRRTDPAALPGLEAMMPGSATAQWLNAPAAPVPGDLRVVAGDIEGDSLTAWLKTLLSDAFYWTDNDLVVQTRSMYGGAPRAGGAASFLLDRGGKVTHFNYFANDRTADAITRGLIDDQLADFQSIGPWSWAGEDAAGWRAALPAVQSPAQGGSERPAVFVLPGILGSNLKVDGERLWLSLHFVNNFQRLKWDPATAASVQADGPVGVSYNDLRDQLALTHDVIPFGFDWRRPMEDEAVRLAAMIDAALAARESTQLPVRIVAHSMGGLLARTLRLVRPATWNRMMARSGARVLMLGTPNGGSFAPMQVMSGDDSFGDLLATVGCLFDDNQARQLIAGMPGLLQLQAALVDSELGLDQAENWQKLADADSAALQTRIDEHSVWHDDERQVAALKWGVPSQPILDQAVALRRQLDAQRDALGVDGDAARILLVVGRAAATPADVRTTARGVEYVNTGDGDGRVTLANACLPGVRTWQVDAAHGDLPATRSAFGAYVELLTTGTTAQLQPVAAASAVGAARGTNSANSANAAHGSATLGAAALGAPLTIGRPARVARSGNWPRTPRDVIAPAQPGSSTIPATGLRLIVRVFNGNLKFIRLPLMLGHYGSLKLTGSERVIDGLLDGALSESLRVGLYPVAIGTNQIYVNGRRNPDDPFVLPRPQAAIVIGLGEEGALRRADLCATVRQGVLAYAQRLGEAKGGGPTSFALAATLIGSSGSEMSEGTSAQAIALGVRQANQSLARVGWPQVGELHLVELFLDRATEALQALQVLRQAQARDLLVDEVVIPGVGGLARPPSASYRGSGYDFVSVQRNGDGDAAPIEFTLDTRRARSEVRGSSIQSALVDQLVRSGASDSTRNPQTGRSLFQLLVPPQIDPFLVSAESIVLQLDSRTACYPWEMLEPPHADLAGSDDGRPWGIRTRLLRKLSTPDYRERPHDAGRDAVMLVIGAPLCNPAKYPPLPGAIAEATAVAKELGVIPLIQQPAGVLVDRLLAEPYKVLHVAGHGDFVNLVDGSGSSRKLGGIVLSGDLMFGPREVQTMRSVPELVFVNCCYLGRIDNGGATATPLAAEQSTFAANVAEELIRIGVRCVVAAGWAVDDEPASAFAVQFYGSLLAGAPFAEAVSRARESIWRDYPASNTWAAYQCYGDPDWSFLTIQAEADEPGAVAQVTSAVTQVTSADALVLILQQLVVDCRYGSRPSTELLPELERIDRDHGKRWQSVGAVAAAFGAAYAELKDFDRATDWYQRAIAASDGGAAISAIEQLGNLRARRGEALDDPQAGRAEIEEGLKLLRQLGSVAMTVERGALLGSAYKRLAQLARRAHRPDEERAALKRAAAAYADAERVARASGDDELSYPALNRIAIEVVLGAGKRSRIRTSGILEARDALRRKAADDPDFWSVVGLTELRIYEALAGKRLARAVTEIMRDIDDLKSRTASPHLWSSVEDQARFVLTPYATSSAVPDAERGAVRTLLEKLGIATDHAPPAH